MRESGRWCGVRTALWNRVGLVSLGVAVAAGTVMLSAPGAAPGPAPVTFAAVGDSITDANSADLAGLHVGDASWVHFATGSGLEFVGGWARGGAQAATMARHVSPVRADVLVIIAGTNDTAHGVPFAVTARNLVAIVRTVGAGRVIVSAIPPQDATPAVAVGFNRRLEPFVQAQGWTFVDAMAGVRDDDRYAAGMTRDGTHPDVCGARVIGAALAEAITN